MHARQSVTSCGHPRRLHIERGTDPVASPTDSVASHTDAAAKPSDSLVVPKDTGKVPTTRQRVYLMAQPWDPCEEAGEMFTPLEVAGLGRREQPTRCTRA